MNKAQRFLVVLSRMIWLWAVHLTWRARAAWAFFAPLVFICLSPLFLGSSDELFRWTGAALQLVGFLLAIINLVGLEQLFGEKSLPQKVVAWAKSGPRWPRNITVSASGIASGTSTMTARVTARRSYTGDIESRLLALQENLVKVDEAVAELRNDSEKMVGELRSEQVKSATQLAGEISKLDEKVGKALVEGATAEWVGIWLFVLGTITGSLSPELCRLFGGVCT